MRNEMKRNYSNAVWRSKRNLYERLQKYQSLEIYVQIPSDFGGMENEIDLMWKASSQCS